MDVVVVVSKSDLQRIDFRYPRLLRKFLERDIPQLIYHNKTQPVRLWPLMAGYFVQYRESNRRKIKEVLLFLLRKFKQFLLFAIHIFQTKDYSQKFPLLITTLLWLHVLDYVANTALTCMVKHFYYIRTFSSYTDIEQLYVMLPSNGNSYLLIEIIIIFCQFSLTLLRGILTETSTFKSFFRPSPLCEI